MALSRVQLEFPRDEIARLDAMARSLGIKNRKRMFEEALALFVRAVEERQRGRRLVFVADGERMVEFSMPALERVKRE